MSVTREQILKKATDIIAKARNTATIDNVLAVHDRIIKASLKSKSSTGAMSRPHLELCHLRKSENSTLPMSQKPEGKKQNKDDRPLSPNSFRIKYPNGKVFAYKMAENGSMTRHEVGEYKTPTYTLDQYQKLHEHIQAHHKELQVEQFQQNHGSKTAENKEEPAGHVPKEQLAKALADLDEPAPIKKSEPRQPWGAVPRLWGKRDAGQPEPLPAPSVHTPRSPLKLTRDNTPLSGHQLAARRAGLPVDTPNLHKMSFSEMQALADSRQVTETRKQAATSGIHFGDRGEVYHRR